MFRYVLLYSFVLSISGGHVLNFQLFLLAVDIISAIEFDKSGDHLATGDRGGRVVLFERTDAKEVRLRHLKDSVYWGCIPLPNFLSFFINLICSMVEIEEI